MSTVSIVLLSMLGGSLLTIVAALTIAFMTIRKPDKFARFLIKSQNRQVAFNEYGVVPSDRWVSFCTEIPKEIRGKVVKLVIHQNDLYANTKVLIPFFVKKDGNEILITTPTLDANFFSLDNPSKIILVKSAGKPFELKISAVILDEGIE